jgi:hypothetical protein
MSVTEWSSMVSQSMVSPIPLNPKAKSNSSQVLLTTQSNSSRKETSIFADG